MLELPELDLDQVSYWSPQIKIGILLGIVLLVVVGVYWFDTKIQFENLQSIKQEEVKTLRILELKQKRAVSLPAYRAQLEQMRHLFLDVLRKLPGRNEIPGLLEDISKVGTSNGLRFKLFEPLEERKYDFYAELPIRIAVLGSYHQIATFISQIAALDRIITLHDFVITPATAKGRGDLTSSKLLLMKINARIYRYIEV